MECDNMTDFRVNDIGDEKKEKRLLFICKKIN